MSVDPMLANSPSNCESSGFNMSTLHFLSFLVRCRQKAKAVELELRRFCFARPRCDAVMLLVRAPFTTRRHMVCRPLVLRSHPNGGPSARSTSKVTKSELRLWNSALLRPFLSCSGVVRVKASKAGITGPPCSRPPPLVRQSGPGRHCHAGAQMVSTCCRE